MSQFSVGRKAALKIPPVSLIVHRRPFPVAFMAEWQIVCAVNALVLGDLVRPDSDR